MGANFSVDSLNITPDSSAAINIGNAGSDNFTLTLMGTGGLGGLNLQNGSNQPALNISANVALGRLADVDQQQYGLDNDQRADLGTNTNLTLTGAVAANTGNFTFTASNSFTGGLTLNNLNGALTLSGSGSILGVTAIAVNGGATLTLDSSASGNEPNNNRIADSTIVTLAGGTFNLVGNSSAATSETIGGLTLGSGMGNVNVTPGSGPTATLTIGGTKIPRSVGGAVNFSSSGTIYVPSFSQGLIAPWPRSAAKPPIALRVSISPR